MAILDRFRAQPRQKHPDAAVRLAFVQEIPIDEHDLLTEIARDDADEGVRSQAIAMLRDIALEAFEGLGEAESLAAVDALTGPKTLLVVAKTAPAEAAAAQAASRVAEPHAIGSI